MKSADDLRSEVLGPDDARRAVVESAVACLRKPVADPRALAAALRGESYKWPRSLTRNAVQHRRVLDVLARHGLAHIAEAEVEGICSAVGLDDGRIENVDVIERQCEI